MISFTWKYSIFQVIQIFIIICYFLQFLFCIGFGYNDVTINILQYELLLIFCGHFFLRYMKVEHSICMFFFYICYVCLFIRVYSWIFMVCLIGHGQINIMISFPYKRTVSNINIVNIFIAIYASWMLDG